MDRRHDALANAVADKVAFCRSVGVEICASEWPSRHLCGILLGDRGEIESAGIDGVLKTFRINVENAPAYRGDCKGLVEARFKSLPAIFKPYVPGYVETDFRQRGAEMDTRQLEIARFLAAKAARGSRATYQQVGEAVGWGHPNGRGLGAHLWIILQELAARGLPPLTAILVRKGERHPEEGAMAYIRSVVGDVDVDALQRSVFAFDWASIPELAPERGGLPLGRAVWLTSFWGFAPDRWGCIGFSDEPKRTRFLSRTKAGVLVAIYVTKNRGALTERGKVVGVMEVSHETGHARKFISGDQWARKEADPDSRGKWLYALRATRVEDRPRGLA